MEELGVFSSAHEEGASQQVESEDDSQSDSDVEDSSDDQIPVTHSPVSSSHKPDPNSQTEDLLLPVIEKQSKSSTPVNNSPSAHSPGSQSKWSTPVNNSPSAHSPGSQSKWSTPVNNSPSAHSPGSQSKWSTPVNNSPSAHSPGSHTLEPHEHKDSQEQHTSALNLQPRDLSSSEDDVKWKQLAREESDSDSDISLEDLSLLNKAHQPHRDQKKTDDLSSSSYLDPGSQATVRQLVKMSVVKKRKGIQKHSRAKREVKVPTNAGQRATKKNRDAIRQAVSSDVW